jgi:hypothetical protein
MFLQIFFGDPGLIGKLCDFVYGQAYTMLGQEFESQRRGLEREVECSNIGEDLILLRRKDGNDYAITELLCSANTKLGDLLKENFRALAIGGLVFSLVCLPDASALALGLGDPLMEEFWDNVRRYGLYFFTVVSGGLYSLAKPLLDLLKEPSTQFLVAIAVAGTFYLIYLTVSTMLGLTEFDYQYSQ